MSSASTPRTATPAWIALFVLVVALAGGAGYLLQRHARAPATNLPAAKSAPGPSTGSAGASQISEKPPLPELLPQFTLQDRDGKPQQLSHWRGQPLIVNYWATWCPPCVREIPLLRKLRQQRRAQRLEVVGIAVDFRDDVLAFAKAKGLDYPLLIGEEDGLEAVKSVGMDPAFPFTLFADSQQRIVALKVGELHEDEATLILDRVAAVDAGRLQLPDARAQISDGLKALATQRAIAAAAKPAT